MIRTAWGWIATCDRCPREIDPDEELCNECSVEPDTNRSE